MVEMLNIDCLEYMKTVPDKFFELAIVDPPYGFGVNMNIGRRKGKRKKHNDKEWDKAPADLYFDELFRVSENQIIWGGNYFDLPTNKCFIVWDKGETMYERDFAECEYAWVSFNESARMYKQSPNQVDRIHPTQKPIKLYKWLLKHYANEGDKIFDSHLGSGSIAIACHDMKFDLVGCEIDEGYYNDAVKRFDNHKKQLKLFQ